MQVSVSHFAHSEDLNEMGENLQEKWYQIAIAASLAGIFLLV